MTQNGTVPFGYILVLQVAAEMRFHVLVRRQSDVHILHHANRTPRYLLQAASTFRQTPKWVIGTLKVLECG